MPFVQGQLGNEPLSVAISTECDHCARKIDITLDSDLKFQVDDADAGPLVFMPHLDWNMFTEPNIIDSY